MRILAIVHNADAGPGVFADSIAAADHQLDTWRPAEGEASPDLASCGAVLSFGGGVHPEQEDLHPWLAEEKRLHGQAVEREVPLLAVCLGAELLAEAAGGSARRASVPEIGWYSVKA